MERTILDLGLVEEEALREMVGEHFVSHDSNHVMRVARGASYFASLETSDRLDLAVAYVAGLIHDLKRPKSEAKDHSKSSEDAAREFLSRFDCLGREGEIIGLVAGHRNMSGGSIRERSVYIADKVLEQMGAYLAFRGAAYVAEVEDFEGMDEGQLVVAQCDVTKKRMDSYFVDGFPERLRPLAQYQKDSALYFIDRLEKGDQLATNLAKFCYRSAREGRFRSIDSMIDEYDPIGGGDNALKSQAIWYITSSPNDFCSDFIESTGGSSLMAV